MEQRQKKAHCCHRIGHLSTSFPYALQSFIEYKTFFDQLYLGCALCSHPGGCAVPWTTPRPRKSLMLFPFASSFARDSLSLAQAPVARFRFETIPMAAKKSMKAFVGLNCREIPN